MSKKHKKEIISFYENGFTNSLVEDRNIKHLIGVEKTEIELPWGTMINLTFSFKNRHHIIEKIRDGENIDYFIVEHIYDEPQKHCSCCCTQVSKDQLRITIIYHPKETRI